MKEVISVELLSEVLGFEISHAQKKNNNEISVFKDGRTDASKFINIYELAHKCKEWAFMSKNYIIVEYEDRCSVFSTGGMLVFTSILEQLNDYIFNPNRVFICAQWILDNKEQK